jgi:hypothetical protein
VDIVLNDDGTLSDHSVDRHYEREAELIAEREKLVSALVDLTADSTVDDVLAHNREQERIAAIDTLLPLVRAAKMGRPKPKPNFFESCAAEARATRSQRIAELEGDIERSRKIISGEVEPSLTDADNSTLTFIPDPGGQRRKELIEEKREQERRFLEQHQRELDELRGNGESNAENN